MFPAHAGMNRRLALVKYNGYQSNVFPAHAGMNRRLALLAVQGYQQRVPRPRGDEPR